MSSEPKFQTDAGPTTADDPKRMLWYGPCGYWTDNWHLVATQSIPCCPTCGAVGFQGTFEEWMNGAKRFQADGHPAYVNFLNAAKEKCGSGVGFIARYEQWLKEHPNGRDTPSPRSSGD